MYRQSPALSSFSALLLSSSAVSRFSLCSFYSWSFFFFFNDTATTEIYTLSLHDALPIERAQSRDTVRRRLGDVLDRDLHVVEAERFQSRQPLAGERDPAGDQVGVQIEPSRAFHERFQVVAQQGLATREIELHDPERLRLAEHTQPVVGAERVGVAGPVGRIRAVCAAQWAAIGQLGDERVGARLLTHGRPG